MKLWAIDYHDDNSASGAVREFFGNKASAKRRGAELDAEPPGGYFRREPEQIDVPTKRAALIDWLNANASIR